MIAPGRPEGECRGAQRDGGSANPPERPQGECPSAQHEGSPVRREAVPRAGVLVIAVGNRSRGDDAIAPLLLDRLERWRAGGDRGADLELLEDFQLQIEHALDLAGRRLVLFVDAGTHTAAPVLFYATRAAAPGASHSSHALAPEAVLGVYRQITGEDPPPAYVLCVRGDRFELGADLSEPARADFEAAWQRLLALCERPDVGYWQATAARATPRPPREGPAPVVSAAP